LSQAGDFSHLAGSLGIEAYESFSVASPFDYENQMKVKSHPETEMPLKWEEIGDLLQKNGGKSLVLFDSVEAMDQFRKWADKQNWAFDVHFEGDREISEIVRNFQSDISSVLCSYQLWEGLDVPGEALTQVIIPSLPFPPKDPV